MGLFNEFAAGGPIAVEKSKAGAPDLAAFAQAAGTELEVEIEAVKPTEQALKL